MNSEEAITSYFEGVIEGISKKCYQAGYEDGKTSGAKTIAEVNDLPVYVYDIASLSNEELRTEWTKMLEDTPCMAVIEDIDSVFDKRTNISGEKHNKLTFDCLLNCIDGIEQSDGVYLVVTTNKLDKIDPALAVVNNNNICSRPGRIDRVVEVPHPRTSKPYEEMVARILTDNSELWSDLVVEACKNSDTMAQFQNRCRNVAKNLYWEKVKKESLK